MVFFWIRCELTQQELTIQSEERSFPQCQHVLLEAKNFLKTCSSNIENILIKKTQSYVGFLQIEKPDDCDTFKFD